MNAVPTVSVVNVSPELAQEWLLRNTSNRTVRAKHVQSLARDMRGGEWRLTGEPIKFAPDGSLLDGQHRLHAIVRAGVVVQLFVAHNIPADSQLVMDSGVGRTAADALHLTGVPNAALVAAGVRLAVNYERGDVFARGTRGGSSSVTHAEHQEFLATHPEFVRAARHAKTYARRADVAGSLVAFTTWRLAQLDEPLAYQFWVDAAERVELRAGDPILTMVDRFAEVRRGRERWTQAMYVSAIFRTWNYRALGKPLKIIKATVGGGVVEVAPIMPPKRLTVAS